MEVLYIRDDRDGKFLPTGLIVLVRPDSAIWSNKERGIGVGVDEVLYSVFSCEVTDT
jgi:hypothetical protein